MTTPSASNDRAALRARLDRLAERGAAHLRDVAVHDASERGIDRVIPYLFVAPVAFLFIQLLHWVHGEPRWDLPWYAILIAMLVVPGAMFLSRYLSARTRPVSRSAALAAFDRAGSLEDRMLTADEFLDRDEDNPFIDAALDDAEAHVDRAAALELKRPERLTFDEPRAWRLGTAAFLTGLLVWMLGEPTHAGVPTPRTTRVAKTSVPADAAAEESDSAIERTTTQQTDRTEPVTDAPQDGGEVKEGAADVSEKAKKTEGRTGAGLSSNAESSKGAGSARGAPTNQGQPLKSKKKKDAAEDPKEPKKKDLPAPEAPKKLVTEESGSTTGRGASRGSNKNPVASDWSSKDQVTTDEDDEVEDDEEVEDESEDSEARGGMQPSLRDRKPPVSRDLSIGFGNQPDPDANGRGGPSEQKKSRGTASLVLGVPIPDRVKGQPNPGKTKTTQERVEPRRENADAIDAQDRTPRTNPIGPVARPRLSAWMRDLVRAYFLKIRSRNATKDTKQP